MDLAVLSDLHLTNSLPYTVAGDTSRKGMVKNYLTTFFTKIKTEKVDFLVVPGDVCHSTLLGPDDLDLLMFFMDLVRDSNIKTIISLGNHDLDGDKSILSFLKNRKKYLVYNNIYYEEDTFWSYRFSDIIFDVIHYCPHHTFLKKALEAGQASIGAKYSVLIGHIGVKGTLHGTTKSIIGIKKEDIENLSKYYDLIILGHHHQFQWVTDKCLYAGAIQQTRIDEKDTVPGGFIISLPSFKIKHIENTVSPRFKIVEGYVIPEDISNSIIKPVIDTESVSESENIEFLKEIVAQDPYYLIKPRLKKMFSITGGVHEYSADNKRVALLKTMKEFHLKKKRSKKFHEHVINIYEEVQAAKAV